MTPFVQAVRNTGPFRGLSEIVSVPGKIDAQEGESYKIEVSISI